VKYVSARLSRPLTAHDAVREAIDKAKHLFDPDILTLVLRVAP
jgi:hypothetical protein